jgi:uncharacterized protein (DUF488 family)
VTIFTIGFTKKSAETFFGSLRASGAKRVVDVRRHNTSQLAGFAKRDDLRFFLRDICGMDYVHLPRLAPTDEILGRYRNGGRDWAEYERDFLALMRSRQIENSVPRDLLDNACLLCSEHSPAHCHRRLVAEHLQRVWGNVEVLHIS